MTARLQLVRMLDTLCELCGGLFRRSILERAADVVHLVRRLVRVDALLGICRRALMRVPCFDVLQGLLGKLRGRSV